MERLLIDDVGAKPCIQIHEARLPDVAVQQSLEIPFRAGQDLRTVRLLKLTLLVHGDKASTSLGLLLILACVLCIPHAGAFAHNRSTANDCGKRSQHCHSIGGARGH